MASYTSFGTRRALGRRYSIDPAILLEMERLSQEYNLAPGREARGIQASQYAEGMAFNREQAALGRAEREAANAQAAKSGMVGTVGNVLTTGAMLRGATMTKGEPFFGKWGTPAQGTPGGQPADVSWTTQPTGTAATGLTGTQVAAPASGLPVSGPPPATTGPAYTVNPSAIDTMGTGFAAEGGGGAATSAGGTVAAETGGATAGSVVGGIAGGIGTAMPYYAAAKAGGFILGKMTEGKGGSVPHYFNEMGQTLDNPLQLEQYAVKEKLGIDNPVINTVLDILNPAGYVVNKLEDSTGTVICTELYRQGLMSDEMYEADSRFGKQQDIEVIAGYHLWAIPLAGAMRKSSIVTWIIKPFAMAWAENMAGKHNVLGAFLNKIGIPFCRFIGKMIMEVSHG